MKKYSYLLHNLTPKHRPVIPFDTEVFMPPRQCTRLLKDLVESAVGHVPELATLFRNGTRERYPYQ